MPYIIRKRDGKFCVFTEGLDGEPKGEPHGCHDSRAEAIAQQRALYVHASPEGEKAESLTARESRIRETYHEQFNLNPVVETLGSVGWVREVFEGYVIVERGGRMFKVPYVEGEDGAIHWGEEQEVKLEYSPKAGVGGLAVVKAQDGSYRWVGWVSNHYRDRDTPPEIIAGAAHREFVEHVEKSGEYPELWVWHTPGARLGQADWLEFADGFLLSSGTFDSAEDGERLAELSAKEPLTMSHGFKRLRVYGDSRGLVTTRYRMTECSILPEGAEANLWTHFAALKEVLEMPLSPKKREFLVKVMGEERVKAVEATTEALKAAAEAAGVDWKEVEAITETDTPTAPTLDTKELVKALSEAFVQKSDLTQVGDGMKQLAEALVTLKAGNDALQAEVKALKERVESLTKADDEKVSAQFMPRVAETLARAFRPSEAESTKADPSKDKDLLKTGPKFMDQAATALAKLAAAVPPPQA